LKHDNKLNGGVDLYRRKIEDHILSLDTKVPNDYVKIYEKIASDTDISCSETDRCYLSVSKIKTIINDVIGTYSDKY
jgi:hypothetical protein